MRGMAGDCAQAFDARPAVTTEARSARRRIRSAAFRCSYATELPPTACNEMVETAAQQGNTTGSARCAGTSPLLRRGRNLFPISISAEFALDEARPRPERFAVEAGH